MKKVILKDLAPCALKRQAPVYSSPTQVGCITITGPIANNKRQFHDDSTGLRVLHRRGTGATVKNLNMDLNEGKEDSISRFTLENPINPIEIEHLDFMFEWILRHPKEFASAQPQIVCWRKKLQEIMCTPYEKTYGWTFYASKVDGVTYMTSYETPAVEYQRLNRDKRDELFTYWGYKFEQLMTTDPSDAAALDEPVNDYDTFQAILSSTIGKTRLMFGAEIDCIDPDKKSLPPPKCYVELKTARSLTGRYSRELENFYAFKLIKWWAQSFIGGIPTILTGYRDEAGVVTSTKEDIIANIPALVKKNGMCWEYEVCLSFLNDFVELVRRSVVESHDRVLYKFEWTPGDRHVQVTQEPADSPRRFVPEWFVERHLPGG